MKKVYIVEYTNENCIGNACLQMEILADSRDEAYGILDQNYPELCVDMVYEKESLDEMVTYLESLK